MHRLLLCLLLALALNAPVYAQDTEEDVDTTEPEESAEESDLDDQGYAEENEDDFEASQEVAADQSVAFPVDI